VHSEINKIQSGFKEDELSVADEIITIAKKLFLARIELNLREHTILLNDLYTCKHYIYPYIEPS
jgi:hypothetical protein